MRRMLDKLLVLDITNNIAGPCCAAMLADHGAEVIHVEKPVWGDDSRHFYPPIGGMSGTFFYANRNKKSLVIDLKDPQGAEIIRNIAVSADVLIESNRPGVMKRLGLDYESIRQLNPSLIYCSISAFGQKGPLSSRAGYDIIAQAYSGMMYYTGESGSGPVKNYFSIGDFVTSYNAYGNIMTALYYRAKTGVGQHIDMALARGLLAMNMCISDNITGIPRRKTGNHDMHLCPYGIFNGPQGESLVIAAINVALWEKLCAAMERPELAHDPRYITNDARCDNMDDVIDMIERWLNTFDSVDAAAKRLTEYGVPNIKPYTVTDILNDRHAHELGWIRELPLPDSVEVAKTCPAAYGYADFSETDTNMAPAPKLGEHNIELLTRFGMSVEEAEKLTSIWMCGAK